MEIFYQHTTLHVWLRTLSKITEINIRAIAIVCFPLLDQSHFMTYCGYYVVSSFIWCPSPSCVMLCCFPGLFRGNWAVWWSMILMLALVDLVSTNLFMTDTYKSCTVWIDCQHRSNFDVITSLLQETLKSQLIIKLFLELWWTWPITLPELALDRTGVKQMLHTEFLLLSPEMIFQLFMLL